MKTWMKKRYTLRKQQTENKEREKLQKEELAKQAGARKGNLAHS